MFKKKDKIKDDNVVEIKEEKEPKQKKEKKHFDIKTSVHDFFHSRQVKSGSYSFTLIVVVFAIVVILNQIVGVLPSKYTSFDVTQQKLYSVGSQTEKLLKDLDQDVTLYLIAESGSEDSTLTKLLDKYKDLSTHIKVEYKDPVVYPNFASQYTDATVSSNSIIVVSDKRSKVLQNSDIYVSEMDYSTYQSTVTGFDGEGLLTSAIDYVTTDDVPVMYTIEGHNEGSIAGSTIQSRFEKENVQIESMNLLNIDSIPEDAACIFINSPTVDFTADDAAKVNTYLQAGGKALIISSLTDQDMPNFKSILANYGVETVDGVVVEGNSNNYVPKYPTYLLPDIQSHDITQTLVSNNRYVLVPNAQGIKISDSLRANLTVESLLKTSDSSYSKVNLQSDSIDKESGDIDGPFNIGVAIKDTLGSDKETKIVYYTTGNLLVDQVDTQVAGANGDLLASSLSWMVDQKQSISIDSKDYAVNNLVLNASDVVFLGSLTTIFIPLVLLIAGILVWVRRRKK